MENSLPNSNDAERQLLGLVLMDQGLFGEIAALEPATFYDANYRRAFAAMRNINARNELINPFTIYEEIKAIAGVELFPISTITNWTYGIPFGLKPDTLLPILKDKALKRDIIKKCNAFLSEAAEDSKLGNEIAASAATTFQAVFASGMNGHRPTVSLDEAIPFSIDRWNRMYRKEIVTVETGLEFIDKRLTGGGLEKGMFHVIGARPGKGKTSLGLDMASHNFLNQNVTVFFTMELSRDVLMDRLIAPLAGVERYKITGKWISNIEIEKLQKTTEFLRNFPMFINHKARSLADMRLALQEIARKTGGKIDLVIVDFLTKMRLEKRDKYASVSANANGLAEFATDFGCAVVCLAQLNREVTKRSSAKEPGRVELTDFRDSGEIEELGRTILALWGDEDLTGQRHRPVRCTCLKQGEGQIFDETLIFDTHFMTFGVRTSLIQPAQLAA